MYVPHSYIIAHTLEDTLAPDGSHVLVFNWAWLFLAAMLHFVLVIKVITYKFCENYRYVTSSCDVITTLPKVGDNMGTQGPPVRTYTTT